MKNYEQVHFIGIKGTGMSALAAFLQQKGLNITGSDVSEEFPTDIVLADAKIVASAFDALNIKEELDLVIYSAAFGEENEEYARARELGIPMMSYPQALGELSRDYFSIGVTGMHGKSTVTAMLATILIAMQADPNVILGTTVPDLANRNFRVGNSETFLAETCEYRRHFLHFKPNVLIISNLEEEHLDYFKDLDDIKSAFSEYIAKLPAQSLLIYNGDDKNLCEVVKPFSEKLKLVSCGFGSENNFQALRKDQESFVVKNLDKEIVKIKLNVPGDHNVLDALLAIVFAYSWKPENKTLVACQKALAEFQGTGRRFEFKGEKDGITVLDDFAHHPTEIRATLQATHERYPESRIFAVFMSHTYSRTETLLDKFATSFSDADFVIINKIFSSAREKKGQVDGQVLTDEIKKNNPNTVYIPEFAETVNYLKENLKAGDVLITMGAGDNHVIGNEFLNG